MIYSTTIRAKRSLAAALWAVGLIAGGSSARASFIDINPTGNAADPPITIAGFDLAPGNALARGSLPLVVGQSFQLYYQASVAGFIHPDGLTSTPTGLTTSYQITAVASFTEVVSSVNASGTVATFSLAPTQSSNSFFQLYYKPGVTADNLAGTGFNQGTLILSGTVAPRLASIGVFSLSTSPGGTPLVRTFDQFVSDHYSGTQTTVGSGSSMVSADVSYINPAFFKTRLSQIAFNSSLVTPFAQTSPSSLFTDHAGSDTPTLVPNLGTVNGFNGKDFQFQADANFSFTAAPLDVPEPASILQAGMGFVGLLSLAGWMRFTKSRQRVTAQLA